MKERLLKRLPILGVLFVTMLLCIFGLTQAVPVRAASSDPTTQEFLGAMKAVKGTAAMDGETLKYTANSAGSYLVADTSTYMAGSRWHNPYMQSRNTLLLHVKSEGVTQIRAYFRTSTKPYSSENSVTANVKADGKFNSLFINFSSLEKATGKLTGFRIEPVSGTGTLYIDSVSFEREQNDYAYAGKIESCTSDGALVTVRGALSGQYSGKDVSIYRTDISNMEESAEGLSPMLTVKADGTSFTAVFPYHDGEITMLSSMFLADVEGVKVSRMFNIGNWRDLTENFYAFTLPSLSASVLDFGAKGDAFTDDTAAIQAAIDDVNEKGGGTVLVPGSSDFYGRRYIVTTVSMKNNVELRVEKGAVLWQSPRDSDYTYEVKKGHDDPNGAATWGHNGLVNNYPLVYFNNVKNAKLTGGGELRLQDTGNASGNTAYKPSYSDYCSSLVHLVTVGVYKSENIEISDLAMIRASCYHIVLFDCNRVYVGNVTMTEDGCLSGDGISIGVGTKNVAVDRCNLYVCDDAIPLVSMSKDEWRGKTWWKTKPNGDNRLENLLFRHNAITPGNTFVFILWGSDAADWTYQQIRNVEIYDNLLGINNPGSKYLNCLGGIGGPYGELNQFSTAVNVRVFGNSYRGGENVGSVNTLNWMSDCPAGTYAKSPSQFVDGTFTRAFGYWEYEGEYKKDVVTEAGSAKINGGSKTNSVYQGLRLPAGEQTFTASVRATAGAKGKLFVRDALTGDPIAAKSFENTQEGTAELKFSLNLPTTVLLGCASESESGSVYFTSPSVTSGEDGTQKFFEQKFAAPNKYFDETGFTRADGMLTGNSPLSSKLTLPAVYGDFDFKFDFIPSSAGANTSAYARAEIDLYRSVSESCAIVFSDGKARLALRTADGEETLAEADFALRADVWVQVGLRRDGGKLTLFADGTELFASDKPSADNAIISLNFYYMGVKLDNVCTAEKGSLTYSHSEHYVEPEDPAVPPKTGCNCSSAAVSMLMAAMCAAAIGAGRKFIG